MRDVPLPSQMDWTQVPGLSNEGRSRMSKGAPRSLGEAESLPGVTPGDVETLWAWLEAKRNKKVEADPETASGFNIKTSQTSQAHCPAYLRGELKRQF